MIEAIVTTFPMFACLFWCCFFLMGYSGCDSGKRLFFFFMLTATFLYLGHCCYFNKEYSLIPLTDTVYSFANLAVFPIFFLYIKWVTTNASISPRNWWVLLPAACVSISIGVTYAYMTKDESDYFAGNYFYSGSYDMKTTGIWLQTRLHQLAAIVFSAELTLVLYFGERHISRFNKSVNDYYSDTENKTFTRMRNLLIYFVIISCLSFVVNLLGKSYFINHGTLLAPLSLLFGTFLFLIGYEGHKRTFTAKEMTSDTEACSEFRQSPDPQKEHTSDYFRDLSIRLVSILREEQLFLLPDLKISDLTSRLQTNRNCLYQAINVQMGTSFSELINRLRIEYAQELMKEDRSLSVTEVCIRSGYLSESSFYRNFKQVSGVSPKKWHQSL